jgi:hypothetical protein
MLVMKHPHESCNPWKWKTTLAFIEGDLEEEKEYLDTEKHHQETVFQTRLQLNKFNSKNPNLPQMDKSKALRSIPTSPPTSRTTSQPTIPRIVAIGVQGRIEERKTSCMAYNIVDNLTRK